MQGCCTVCYAQQDVAWSKLGRCTRVLVMVRQEEGIVWQQAIKQMFPLYLYSRHGYCVSSSDGSSTPCHIYISLFFVHLPLFSFSQTASFFFQRPFLFLFWKWLPSFLYKLTPWGQGEVCLTVCCVITSPSHLKLHEIQWAPHCFLCSSNNLKNFMHIYILYVFVIVLLDPFSIAMLQLI